MIVNVQLIADLVFDGLNGLKPATQQKISVLWTKNIIQAQNIVDGRYGFFLAHTQSPLQFINPSQQFRVFLGCYVCHISLQKTKAPPVGGAQIGAQNKCACSVGKMSISLIKPYVKCHPRSVGGLAPLIRRRLAWVGLEPVKTNLLPSTRPVK